MKTMTTLCFLCLCWLGRAQSDTARVRQSMHEQQLAWNAGDIKGFMAYYWQNDSLTFIGKKGVTYGWNNTLNNYLKSYPDKASMGTLVFTLLDVRQLSAESIYVIGKWQLEKEKPVGGHFTLLWKKLNGRWVIVSDHTS